MAPEQDWICGLLENRSLPSRQQDVICPRQMDELVLKGPHSPKNLYPGSSFTPDSFRKPEEAPRQAEAWR